MYRSTKNTDLIRHRSMAMPFKMTKPLSNQQKSLFLEQNCIFQNTEPIDFYF